MKPDSTDKAVAARPEDELSPLVSRTPKLSSLEAIAGTISMCKTVFGYRNGDELSILDRQHLTCLIAIAITAKFEISFVPTVDGHLSRASSTARQTLLSKKPQNRGLI